ncbi:PaaI family thioesterase [Paracrocinitomix mangrovi]|uniref:PaaI family thioesterase n=1 Tax=Paracrocinitomix mangrovi TaxID=2862509 RepID=UPI001C8E8111|nr:PaaI family thioesterase [Paracrocinitomix mangrovi]UKN02838.1 PaaI family thioesterase [Paracrocinitomix mangrovi]
MKDFRDLLIKVYSETNQFGRLLGTELTKFEEDGIEYKLVISKDHLATPTTAHGGVIAAYMDGIMGVAALHRSSADGNLVSTVEFKINYILPVRKGDVLIGKGTIISKGKRIIIAQGEIFNQESGELVAMGTGTFNAYPHQKSGMTSLDFDFI